MNRFELKNDELRREVIELRRRRDAHQIDESDYIDGVMAIIEREKLVVLSALKLKADNYMPVRTSIGPTIAAVGGTIHRAVFVDYIEEAIAELQISNGRYHG